MLRAIQKFDRTVLPLSVCLKNKKEIHENLLKAIF